MTLLSVAEARALIAEIAKRGLKRTPPAEAIEALCVVQAHQAGGPDMLAAATEVALPIDPTADLPKGQAPPTSRSE